MGSQGRISFVDPVSNFGVGYSSADLITLEGYSDTAALLDSVTGDPNLETGAMGYLLVQGPGLAYVVIRGEFGNYWIVDDIQTDAEVECEVDFDCQDDVFCNGQEQCVAWVCQPGEPPACEDDGLFCNGEEYCDEFLGRCNKIPAEGCVDDGLYCNGEEYCDEQLDRCEPRNVPQCEDDGLFCNGEETCVEETRACASEGDPCGDDEVCDEPSDQCLGPGGDSLTETDDLVTGGGCTLFQ
ncbi:MAG: hypothetical protein M5R36_22410 [Deltaproteobacteria bacterium]|nr:hypothetical protein [Deltaproteobacteria bacterium]